MNTYMRSFRPARTAVVGFLGLMCIAIVLAAVAQTGVIDESTEKRAMGLLLGLAAVVTGNFLPKLRPLRSPDNDFAKAMSIERFAGWILVLAGIAFIGLFAYAPLSLARTISSVIGIGAIAAITTNWAWMARGLYSVTRETQSEAIAPDESRVERRRITVWLIFSFFYVFTTASVMFLFGDQPWADKLGTWMMISFWMLYAILYAVLGTRRVP